MVRQFAICPQQEAGGVAVQLAHVTVAAVSAPGAEGLAPDAIVLRLRLLHQRHG